MTTLTLKGMYLSTTIPTFAFEDIDFDNFVICAGYDRQRGEIGR
jgi:hypothetical protein